MWLISHDLTVSIHSAIAKTISVNQGVPMILGCTYFLPVDIHLFGRIADSCGSFNFVFVLRSGM